MESPKPPVMYNEYPTKVKLATVMLFFSIMLCLSGSIILGIGEEIIVDDPAHIKGGKIMEILGPLLLGIGLISLTVCVFVLAKYHNDKRNQNANSLNLNVNYKRFGEEASTSQDPKY